MTCCLKHGVDAGDALLGVLGYTRVRKDINDPDAFDKIVAAISLAMEEAVSGIEERAFSRVLGLSDIDWASLSPANFNASIIAIEAVMPSAEKLAKPITAALGAMLPDILEQSAASVAIQVGEHVTPAYNEAVVQYLRGAESLFVTDYLKRRNAKLALQIRRIVADALAAGATRASIVADIERKVGPAAILGRSRAYYDIVAGQFANQARMYGLLSSMEAADIQNYIFVAVMDEVTGEICRALDGTVFSVSGGVAMFERLAENPHAAKAINPWVQQGKGPGGEDILYVTDAFGHRKAIAEVLRSGYGNLDDKGEHRMLYTPAQLEAMGIPYPPLHANCRSTIVADV